MATLISLNVGMPRDVSWQGRTVHTGIWKAPVSGPRLVRRLNIDGDGQGDLAGHGGEQRAVLVYQVDSYRYWRDHLGRDDLEFGQFGENFTVDGLSDADVCIGDRYRIGDAEFEVSQPRVTCYRVGLRLGEPAMPALLVAHHRPGFYLRVHPPTGIPGTGIPGTGGEVTFARSGLSVPWSADYRSILELAEACDVPTRWSCRTGVCHTCATAVLAGDTRYATEPLEPPPPGQALLCCAVPHGELVLDL